MRDRIRIVTPENVLFEHEVAELPARALAWALDVVVTAVMLGAVSYATMLVPRVASGAGAFVAAVGTFVAMWGYATLCEWWSGRTLGKRIVGLRTVGVDGLPIGFVQAATRNLLRVVDLLPGLYLVGVVCALVDERGRRLGDLAAGTWVVRERRLATPSAVMPASERHRVALPTDTVDLALRGITVAERDLMVELGLRRESIPLAVRHDLFASVAAHLEGRLRIARPDHVSPEKWVLTLTVAVMDAAAVEAPVRNAAVRTAVSIQGASR